MRPSNETGFVAILDTLAECKIVQAAIDDHTIPNPPFGATLKDLMDGTVWRFRIQAQHNARPPVAGERHQLAWNANPEFRIEPQDVAFVRLAAEHALTQKTLAERIFKLPSKQRRAAHRILQNLEVAPS